MTTSLIDARAFREQIVNEVSQRVSGAVASAIREGLAGVNVNVAAPQVSVAAPNVAVEGSEVTGLEELAKEMAQIKSLLTSLIALLAQPVTRTVHRVNDEIDTVTETRG